MIFKGSRFVGSNLFMDTDNEMAYIAQPHTAYQIEDEDLVYQFVAGDRLDILAEKFYGKAQMQWLILYANPQFSNETEISEGSILTIPNPERVL